MKAAAFDKKPAGHAPEPDCERSLLFSSGLRELRTSGMHTHITVPARDADNPDGAFQQTLAATFERASKAGQDNPMVIGAIPFDLSEPSCLYLPENYEWRDRAASSGPRPDNVNRPGANMPGLVAQRSLPDETGFKRAVEQAIVNFRHSDIRKVVLSGIRELEFSDSVDIDGLFASLCAQNPTGYQFRVPVPEGGELIGVSPELLLRKEGDRIITNPLAGSAKRMPDPVRDQAVADALMQSEKDQYEHSLVIEDIKRVLAPFCAELDVPEQPSLINTAALWHLSTRVEGRLSNPALNALQLASQLHPTPAVCGLPTEKARQLIRLVENFDRGLFTGIVGWCDAEGNGEWVVTIRCGIVNGKSVRLFAGAGIVEASQPASEWAEIQTKLSTMLNACGLGPSTSPLTTVERRSA
ncbi:isochorismate synthase [Agrobacterium vitis]|nr:isochorismate synthase [Agrobacterium vitis]MBE1436447.1 isochorismate synthase [Agrobacterium vitis]